MNVTDIPAEGEGRCFSCMHLRRIASPGFIQNFQNGRGELRLKAMWSIHWWELNKGGSGTHSYARHGFRTVPFSVFSNHVYIRKLDTTDSCFSGCPGYPWSQGDVMEPLLRLYGAGWVQHVHATLRQFFVFPVRLFSLFVFLFDW